MSNAIQDLIERESAAKLPSTAELRKQLDAAKKAERDNRKSRQKKRTKKVKSVQALIGYEAMTEDGLCFLGNERYSKTVMFKDINRQTGSNDEQTQLFQQEFELYNYFEYPNQIQYTVINRKATDEEIAGMYFEMVPLDGASNNYRAELNTYIDTLVRRGGGGRVLEHYFTFTVSAKSERSAREQLTRIENEVVRRLKEMGSSAEAINGFGRLQVINGFFEPNEPFIFDYQSLVETGLTTKDAIAPMSITVPQRPLDIMQANGNYYRFLTLRTKGGWPSEVSDRLIAVLANAEVDMVINFHLAPVPQQEAIESIEETYLSLDTEKASARKKARMESKEPDTYVSLELADSIEEVLRLREELRESNQKMLMGTYLVCIYAKSIEELNEHTQAVKAATSALSYRFTALETSRVLIQAMNASLPLGACELEEKRMHLTTTAAIHTPFYQSQYQEYGAGALYYGTEPESNKLLFIDRTNLSASHGAYLGASGSGKSFAVKREIVQLLLKMGNVEVWISDPSGEYRGFVEALEGRYIPIKPDSDTFINMFEIAKVPETGKYNIAKKSQFILGLVEGVMQPEKHDLSIIRSVVDTAVKELYETFIPKLDNGMQPTITDFIEVLEKRNDDVAKRIIASFETYVSGTMIQFSNQTNIDYKSRIYAFGMRETGEVYKGLAAHVVNDFLYNRMLENCTRGIRTAIYFDEIQTSLRNPLMAEYMLNLWATSRHYLGMATAITQIPETLTDNAEARKILLNSYFVAMYSIQDPRTIVDLYNLSHRQVDYITNPSVGSGLYVIDGQKVPFTDSFPKGALYEVMTSDPRERLVLNG